MASLVPVGSVTYASARATRVQAKVVTLPRFSGLKATSLGPDSFSLGKLPVCSCLAQGCDSKFVPFKTNAAYKVAVLGAGSQRGGLVSLVLCRTPSVSIPNLYDETRETANLSHESTRVVGYHNAIDYLRRIHGNAR